MPSKIVWKARLRSVVVTGVNNDARKRGRSELKVELILKSVCR